MLTHITAARYVTAFTVWLRFNDGSEGTVDLAWELMGPVFEPLKDVKTFSAVRLHPELKTLVWPNGADFPPEFLRS
jgi:Protein of unknown function (DUF2442)